MEVELCKYLIKVDSMLYGLTNIKISEVCCSFAEIKELQHRFDKANNGWHGAALWLFMELPLRTQNSTRAVRTIGFNEPPVLFTQFIVWARLRSPRYYTNHQRDFNKGKTLRHQNLKCWTRYQHNTRKCGQCFWTYFSISFNFSTQTYVGWIL